jgi:hypothetical protein
MEMVKSRPAEEKRTAASNNQRSEIPDDVILGLNGKGLEDYIFGL